MLRFRPVDKVIDDINSMPYREFYIIDDTVMLPGKRNMKYLMSLMERTAELNVSIFLASTMMMVTTMMTVMKHTYSFSTLSPESLVSKSCD